MPAEILNSTPILGYVRSLATAQVEIYLVGGAVRDALLGRENHDLDFVQAGDPRPFARQLANRLGAAYYTLDGERRMGRVVLQSGTDKTYTLDFTPLDPEGLAVDLRRRDFTINSLALRIDKPDQLIDPLGGETDLAEKRLRISSPTAIADDPIRALRAVRMALEFELRMTPETLRAVRAGAPQLGNVSVERRRDELFRLLDGRRSASAIRLIDQFGAVEAVLPGLSSLKGAPQSAPHIYDVWTHTLDTLAQLLVLRTELSPDETHEPGGLAAGLLSLRLGRYRTQIAAHLGESLNGLRTLDRKSVV
jgi:tRNA nucleotidyltransferase/poly(A) polymerase